MFSYRSYFVVLGFASSVVAGCSSSNNNDSNGCDAAIGAANLSCDDPDVTSAIQLVRAMSLEEKVQQMSGPEYNPNNMFDQQDNTRMQVPGFKYMDGPRGVRWYNSDYGTTVFPVAAARAATWNPELERLIAKAAAREMHYLGRHVLLAPTVNQVTHPRWGRAQETYGEDSFLLGEMGVAFINGTQYDPAEPDAADPYHEQSDTYRVQACVKHFAANNIEDTRIYVNAVLDERTLREVYLPHFKKAADAGVSCFMTSYNRVNGSYAGYSREIVRDILKSEWNYTGYVISDWFAKGNTTSSPVAGLDVEMPFSSGTFPSLFDSAYFYGSALTNAVNSNLVNVTLVDEAVLRILHQKVRNGVIAHDVTWTPWLTKSDGAQQLALDAARQGTVLLRNGPTAALTDDVLPLSREALSKIAVVGQFANSENMGDKGSSDAKVVDSELVITPFEGIRDAFGKQAVSFQTISGNEGALADTDVIVVVGAYYYADLARSSSGEEGEWKDRVSMQLPDRDLANINAALALKADRPALKVIVVIKSGGAVVTADWQTNTDAIIMAWYGGMREGQALGEIIFGDVNPSGKLVQTVPKRELDLPTFNNATNGDVNYSYYHGYRYFDREALTPEFYFGHGLSYTTFAYSNLTVTTPTATEDGVVTLTVDVTNTGARAGSEVVQAYVGYMNTALNDTWGRPVKELRGFARVADIAPGETRTVTINIQAADLAYWDVDAQQYSVEKMEYQLYVGPSANTSDVNTLTNSFSIQ